MSNKVIVTVANLRLLLECVHDVYIRTVRFLGVRSSRHDDSYILLCRLT